MVKISKDGHKIEVSKGAYESYYKRLGYKPEKETFVSEKKSKVEKEEK